MHTPARRRASLPLLTLSAAAALSATLAAPPAHADDVVLDRAAWTRSLNDSQDLLIDLDRVLTQTPKLHPSDHLKLHGDRIRLEERMHTLTKTLRRADLDPGGARLPRDHVADDLNDAIDAAILLNRDLTASPIPPAERDKLTRRAGAILERLSNLQRALRALPRAPSRPANTTTRPPQDPPPKTRRPAPMSPERFRDLNEQLARTTFSSQREALVASAARDNHFSTQQCIAILRAFVHESDKADVGVILHPRVTDPENWHKVYGEFIFDTHRESLRGRVELD